MKNKRKLIICLLVVLLLGILTVAGTYAFFSASNSNNNAINGTAATTSLDLSVSKVAGTGPLIPQLDDTLDSALLGTDNNSCIDGNGNTVCQVYSITVKNSGNATVVLNGKIEIEGSTYDNLRWELLKDATTRNENYTSNEISTTLLASGLSLASNEDKTYYVAIWISENSDNQSDTDTGDFTGTVSFNAADGSGVTSTFIGQCLAKGTKILMENGLLKNIEDIKYGDRVMSFNHMTGKLESQRVYIAYKGEGKSKSFTLTFANGEVLSIVGIHDLFSQKLQKYVTITEDNAIDFIGDSFYDAITSEFVELTSVSRSNEEVEFYSIYSEYNENVIANNMLTLSDDVDIYLNVFEFKDDLTVDQDALARDIDKYGLFDISNIEIAYDFERFHAQYLNIIVGKKLTTWDRLKELRSFYND